MGEYKCRALEKNGDWKEFRIIVRAIDPTDALNPNTPKGITKFTAVTRPAEDQSFELFTLQGNPAHSYGSTEEEAKGNAIEYLKQVGDFEKVEE